MKYILILLLLVSCSPYPAIHKEVPSWKYGKNLYLNDIENSITLDGTLQGQENDTKYLTDMTINTSYSPADFDIIYDLKGGQIILKPKRNVIAVDPITIVLLDLYQQMCVHKNVSDSIFSKIKFAQSIEK